MKARIFAADPRFCQVLPLCERIAAQVVKRDAAQLARKMACEELSPADSNSIIAELITSLAIRYLEAFSEPLLDAVFKVSCEQQAIPNRDAVDKLIRYEAAAERNLSRALDRLEYLQRRRKEEAAPPRLNLT